MLTGLYGAAVQPGRGALRQVALMQWNQEIVRHTEPNALVVTLYYGAQP